MKIPLLLGTTKRSEEGVRHRNRAVLDHWWNTYIIGSPRKGKTNFMHYLAGWQLQECALVVLDPHGELAPFLASRVPEDRLVYADKNNPLVINPLSRNYDLSEIAEELGGAINASVDIFAPDQVHMTVKMGRALRNALQVFRPKHLTLEYLINFLDDFLVRKEHFEEVIKTDYWRKFDNLKSMEGRELRMSASRITDRATLLYENEVVRTFLEGEDEFDLEDIIKNKKVVCFNLEGISSDGRNFIGNLITYAIRTYIVHAPESQHTPSLGVYVDEFHNFINSTFGNSIVECSKKGINYVLAHHNFQQIDEKTLSLVTDSSYLTSIFGGTPTIAKYLVHKYPDLKADELVGLPKYHTYISIEDKPQYIETVDCSIERYVPPEKPKEIVNFFRNDIITIKEGCSV